MMLVQTLALERAVSTSFGSGRAFQAEFDRDFTTADLEKPTAEATS